MNKLIILFLLIGLAGCSQQVDWAKDQVGMGPTEEEKAAAREVKIQKIKEANDSVAGWATELNQKTLENGGYEHHQGFLDVDPWGNNLKAEYSQKGTQEILTVRSAGPDGIYSNQDDIVHSKELQNLYGWAFGENSWLPVVLIWLGVGFLANCLAFAVNRNKKDKDKQALNWFKIIAIVIFAPLAIILYGLYFLVMVLGSVIGLDPPDIDIDVFPDIDLFD